MAQKRRILSLFLRPIFFEVVDSNYLNDGLNLVAEYMHVLMDVDNMTMHRIMGLVKIAAAIAEKKAKGK